MPIDAPIHVNEANLPRVLNAGAPVLLVFWKRDCPACDQLAPTLDRLAKAYAGRVLIAKINATDDPGLARRYATTHLPALFLFKEGQQVERGIGAASERELDAWLRFLIAGGARPPAPSGPSMPVHGGTMPDPSAARPPETGNSGTVRGSTAGTAAGAGHPVTLTDATFEQTIRSSHVPVLIDFWAEWCGPCKMIAPSVTQLAQEFSGRALVGKLNVDQNPRTAAQFGVMSIPTLLIFHKGQVVDQIVGAQPLSVLRQRLARHVA